jgi:hypothetical protein
MHVNAHRDERPQMKFAWQNHFTNQRIENIILYNNQNLMYQYTTTQK